MGSSTGPCFNKKRVRNTSTIILRQYSVAVKESSFSSKFSSNNNYSNKGHSLKMRKTILYRTNSIWPSIRCRTIYLIIRTRILRLLLRIKVVITSFRFRFLEEEGLILWPLGVVFLGVNCPRLNRIVSGILIWIRIIWVNNNSFSGIKISCSLSLRRIGNRIGLITSFFWRK